MRDVGAELRSPESLARELGVDPARVVPYGRGAAKLALGDEPASRGRLVLVSAITPTPHGEGKTTTAIGLGMGLGRIGAKAIVCLREPSMGPYFGRKGGGSGGGRATVEPRGRIDLHFTGDLHAVTSAHDLLAALVDHALHVRMALHDGRRLDPRRVRWSRVLDVDDRALRHVVVGLGGRSDGVPRESRFEITAASELMAVLCLARDHRDLHARVARIVVGEDEAGGEVSVADLGSTDVVAALLHEALEPNLVQTAEGTPALVHGGPFANVAHGCSSVVATKLALAHADVVVTEAGFDFALGGEKFLHLKCRSAGLAPDAVLLVATLRALAHHGRGTRDPVAEGLENLRRHVANVRTFGFEPLVVRNAYEDDADEDVAKLARACDALGVRLATSSAFRDGGAGAEALARTLLDTMPHEHPRWQPLYALDAPYAGKLHTVATRLYGAADVAYTAEAARELARIEQLHPGLGVCVAKTPDSFSDDATSGGLARDFVPTVTEVSCSVGAGFVVARMGPISTMPGLPRAPRAFRLRLETDGTLEEDAAPT